MTGPAGRIRTPERAHSEWAGTPSPGAVTPWAQHELCRDRGPELQRCWVTRIDRVVDAVEVMRAKLGGDVSVWWATSAQPVRVCVAEMGLYGLRSRRGYTLA